MDPITQQAVLATAGAAGGDKVYVDDVFSTFLYDGTGAALTINNGLDLDGEGGMVWTKARTGANLRHQIWDTERGKSKYLFTHEQEAESTNNNASAGITSFNNNGFSLGLSTFHENVNGQDMVSWSFRKAPGFFDIVTYTGNGTNQTIPHNLESVPGFIVVKAISGASAGYYMWTVYHRGLSSPETSYTYLDANVSAYSNYNGYWNGTAPTSTHFSVGNDTYVNATGHNYVAYVFAHDEPVFGTGGDESIIKCGSFTGASHTESLGFEPQWLLAKKTNDTGDWYLIDNMRGFHSQGKDSANLRPNTKDDENTAPFHITSDGFYYSSGSASYMYIAIRRPHKPPEVGTDVFMPSIGQIDTQLAATQPNFPVDMLWSLARHAGNNFSACRLTKDQMLYGWQSNGAYNSSITMFDYGDTVMGPNQTGQQAIYLMFKRAVGFFDIVVYNSNNQTPQSLNHNLGVEPEMMIFKSKGFTNNWWVYHKDLGLTKATRMDANAAPSTASTWLNNTAPTSSVFTIGSGGYANWHGTNSDPSCYAFLFASLPGISKVGTYNGYTNNNVDVDCGFTSGARLIIIRNTTNAGDWYVWNSSSGIVSGNDPFVFLNYNGNEITNTNYITPLTSGFTVNSGSGQALNETGNTYMFLAIA